MKYIIICVVIIAIIWACNGYTSAFIGDSSRELMGYVRNARDAANTGDVAAVNAQIATLHDEWEAVESRWEMLVDHREVEKVDTLMTHLIAMAGEGKLDDMMPELEELAFFLTHIDEKHMIRAENIF